MKLHKSPFIPALIFLFVCYCQLAFAQFNYQHPIPFAPEKYVCYQSLAALKIDGVLQEESWNLAPWTNDFVDIEGNLKPNPPFQTRAKMLWDSDYLYIAAQISEPHVWGKLHQRDTVIFYDDDFEVFIDPDGDGTHYYEFELNALNTVWDLLMLRPYRDTISKLPHYVFNWNLPGWKTATSVQGSINDASDTDEGWTVEMAIPWSALKELAQPKRSPKDGEYWRINFSRVDWHMDIVNGQYKKQVREDGSGPKAEENWVWSPSGRISMHQPETWGYLFFKEVPVGSATSSIPNLPEEAIKWGLWQMFYQQHQHYAQYRRFGTDLKRFTIPDVEVPDYQFRPFMFVLPSGFEIMAPSLEKGIYWHIRQDGRIWRD